MQVDELIRSLQALLPKVTPGPWDFEFVDYGGEADRPLINRTGKHFSLGGDPDDRGGNECVMCSAPYGTQGDAHCPSESEAAYIALCNPENIRLLLEHIALQDKFIVTSCDPENVVLISTELLKMHAELVEAQTALANAKAMIAQLEKKPQLYIQESPTAQDANEL